MGCENCFWKDFVGVSADFRIYGKQFAWGDYITFMYDSRQCDASSLVISSYL